MTGAYQRWAISGCWAVFSYRCVQREEHIFLSPSCTVPQNWFGLLSKFHVFCKKANFSAGWCICCKLSRSMFSTCQILRSSLVDCSWR